jgi:hypothetical protein
MSERRRRRGLGLSRLADPRLPRPSNRRGSCRSFLRPRAFFGLDLKNPMMVRIAAVAWLDGPF